ncbi:MAG: TolC family protein [Ferruginibacter sp.]
MRKNSSEKKLGLIIVLLAIITNVHAQTKNEFSIQQAVDYGLKNAVQVKNALIDIKNQEENNREVTSQALPQIKGVGAFNDFFDIPLTPIPGEFFGQPAGTFKELPFTEKYSASATITLNQTIFDGQVFIGLKARSAAIAFYKKQAEVTQEQIKANIYKIYYQLVVGQKQLARRAIKY